MRTIIALCLILIACSSPYETVQLQHEQAVIDSGIDAQPDTQQPIDSATELTTDAPADAPIDTYDASTEAAIDSTAPIVDSAIDAYVDAAPDPFDGCKAPSLRVVRLEMCVADCKGQVGSIPSYCFYGCENGDINHCWDIKPGIWDGKQWGCFCDGLDFIQVFCQCP